MGKEAETVNPLCGACVEDIQRRLDELPVLLGALRTFLGVTPKTALRSRIKRTPDQSCPLDPRVDALLSLAYEIVDRAGGWKVRIADVMRRPAAQFLIWVGEHQELRYFDGVDHALAIRRVHKQVNKIVGLDRAKQIRHAPCPDCGHYSSLWNWVGEEVIRCDRCDLVMPLADYEEYCAELLEDHA